MWQSTQTLKLLKISSNEESSTLSFRFSSFESETFILLVGGNGGMSSTGEFLKTSSKSNWFEDQNDIFADLPDQFAQLWSFFLIQLLIFALNEYH